jgi:dolichol-phosphate mannosyltransferase
VAGSIVLQFFELYSEGNIPTVQYSMYSGNMTQLPDYSQIPVHDPLEALRFCQALKTSLESQKIESTGPCFVSVVIPVYNEEENIPILHNRLTQVFSNIGSDYEIIFVDDGSSDGSVSILSDIIKTDQRVTLVELARNFGHQIAISAGLEFSRGRGVIIMDADLQDPPEVLPGFIEKWQEGYDVVYAIREERKESWLKKAAYKYFYRILKKIANIEIPLDSGDFCIMDRRVVDEIVRMPERNRFVRGIRSWVGLKQVGLAYERDYRNAGKPKYTFTKLVYLALDGLVSFSFIPLRIITILGMLVSSFSLAMAVFYLIKRIFFSLNPPGFATLIVSIFFFAGIQLTMLGVIGEYIGRIFEEVKQRPLYILKRVSRK